MKIPIYTQLKSKLESKGLDSTTSGQIAWFVCSFFVSHLIFEIWIFGCLSSWWNNERSSLQNIIWGFTAIYHNHFVLFSFMFVIFIINLLYVKNILPLLLSIFTTLWLLNYEYLMFISVMTYIICAFFLLKTKHYNLFCIYTIGIVYMIFAFVIANNIPIR